MAFLDCDICKIHHDYLAQENWEIGRNELWILRHHPDPSPLLGWLILDAVRHIGGPVEFNQKEASDWGLSVKRASCLVRELTGCDRIYSIAFGEGAKHLHLHLIPRFEGDFATKAWALADHYRNVCNGTSNSIDPKEVAKIVGNARNLWK